MVRDARRHAGLTQVELARRAGVTQSMVSAYENDRREPGFSTLDRLLRAAGHRLVCEAVEADEPPVTVDDLRRRRDAVIELLEAGGARNPRVVASAAQGIEGSAPGDLLVVVDLDPHVGAVGLISLERQLARLVGRSVDLAPATALTASRARTVVPVPM